MSDRPSGTDLADLAAEGRKKLRHSLSASYGAQAINIVIVTAQRFLMVPLFLMAWGSEVYGAWLVLLASAPGPAPVPLAETRPAGWRPVAARRSMAPPPLASAAVSGPAAVASVPGRSAATVAAPTLPAPVAGTAAPVRWA